MIAANKAPEWRSGADALTNNYLHKKIEGRTLKLSCPAKGKPRPNLFWYKNGEAFYPKDDKIRVKGTNLKFTELRVEDEGNYTCAAQNSEGFIEFTFVVHVIERIWPLETNVSSNISVYEGEDAKFFCIVTNDKSARIQWLRTERAAVYPQHTFLQSANKSPEILILHDVRKADSGQYTCLVGNEYGSMYRHMYLVVLDPATTTVSTTTTPTTTTATTTTCTGTITTTHSTSPTTIAFSATKPAVTSLNANQVIVMTDVQLNEGAGYNDSTGEFKAPENGLYLFHAQLCVLPKRWIFTSIDVDTKSVARGGHNYQDSHFCSSLSAIVRVRKGQKVVFKAIHPTSLSTDTASQSQFFGARLSN